MATRKAAGGVEDLLFGMTTNTQLRKGNEVVITQINGAHIPYDLTRSITQKIDQMDNLYGGDGAALLKHMLDYDNPHRVTAEEAGAAEEIHTHTISQIIDLQDDLDNKAALYHIHDIDDVTDLQDDLDLKADIVNVYDKTDHITASTGAADAAKPIVLDNTGKLDPTIAGSGLIFVAMFTPIVGDEYPDDTGHTHGDYWGIWNVDDTLGYTFTEGDLLGGTIFNGDMLVLGTTGWGFVHIGIVPEDYYRVDGTIAISAPFAGGTQKLSNLGEGTEDTDGVTKGQMDTADTANVNVQADYTETVDTEDSYIKNVPIFANRNVLIDGEIGRINQSGFDGNWDGISGGAYGYDMWKKTGSVPTDIYQMVEEGCYKPSAQYILSGNGMTSVLMTSPASGNWTVGGIPNTATNVQLERGTVATEFEVLPYSDQLSRVQRYYWKGEGPMFFSLLADTGWRVISCQRMVTMRVKPAESGTVIEGDNLDFASSTAAVLNIRCMGDTGDAWVSLEDYVADARL